MKYIVSGWPGCGSTTLSILLAKNLTLKLYRGSASHRFFLDKLNLSQTGEGVIMMENLIQPFWGPIYDKYMKELFLSSEADNIIVDSDITGFLTGKQDSILSIFLHSNKESRLKHFKFDNRPEEGDLINEIDQKVFREYNKLYKINFLNLNEVATSYSLMIDNSSLSISAELKLVYRELLRKNSIQEADLKVFDAQASELDKHYWEVGKKGLLAELESNDQIISGAEIVKDIRNKYPDEVAKLPDNLRMAIENA